MTGDIIIRRITDEEKNKSNKPSIGQELGGFLQASGASKHMKAMKKKSEKAKAKEYNKKVDSYKTVEEPKPTLTLTEELKALSSTIQTQVDDFSSPDYIPLTHELIAHTIQGGEYDEDGNPILDDVINKQSRSYKKDNDDHFDNMFQEEQLLLWNVIKDTSEFVNDLNARSKAMFEDSRRKSSISGINKAHSDLIISLDSSRNTLLHAIKQSSDLKKTVGDFKFKKAAQDAKAGTGGAEENSELLISSFIQQLQSNGGRDLAMGNMGIGSGQTSFDPIEEIMKLDPKLQEGNRPIGEAMHYADYQDMMGEVLDRRTENYRDENITKRIMYENQGVELCIALDVGTGEWDLFARDSDGNMVPDYPLPTKETIGTVEFMETTATDSRGLVYKIVEVDGDDQI